MIGSRAELKAANAGVSGLAFALAFCVAAVPIGFWFIRAGGASVAGDASDYFVTLNLFVAQDMWAGPVVAAILLYSWGWGERVWSRVDLNANVMLPALVAVAILGSVFLRFAAHHNYPLSLDEFMPTFQAAIFRGGNLMAPLSDEAFAIRDQLQPFFTYVDEERQLWIAHYRPIHAAILSLFPPLYAQAAAHALLSGITLIAMADIARRLFPDRANAPVLAAALVLGSPQVLLTSASGFAFTTHLAFNTVWLALFLRGSWTAHVMAATVGFFALGIHQVHVHAIYVFPFGIAMLLGYFGSRWKTLPYIVAYAVGVPLWIMWPEMATWLQTGDASALPRALLEVEYFANYLDRSDTVGAADRQFSGLFLVVNLWRFALWMSPAIVLLLALALTLRPRLGMVPVICLIGFIFTVVASHVLLPNQMHTWGSRYYHPAIANVAIVAMAAYDSLADNARVRTATWAALMIGAVILIPWRAWQVHEKVGPRAAMQSELEASGAENIIVTATGAWFMPDFIRNDPYLRDEPFYYLNRDTGFEALNDGSVKSITGADLVELGLPHGTYLEPGF
jgi:hypothetical protein